MNRAFVRENDLEHAGIDIPERPLSDEPNYVTPRGLSLLHQTIDDLEKERETLNAKSAFVALSNIFSFLSIHFTSFEAANVENAFFLSNIDAVGACEIIDLSFGSDDFPLF
jgi:hypothetical protein